MPATRSAPRPIVDLMALAALADAVERTDLGDERAGLIEHAAATIVEFLAG